MPLLLTWKADNWPYENIVRMSQEIDANGVVTEPWRTAAHTQTFVGDRAYLLRQGEEPRGLFGVGTVAGEAINIDPSNPQGRKVVPVQFTRFVDPTRALIVPSSDVKRILDEGQINTQQSGILLSKEQADQFDDIISSTTPNTDWSQDEIDLIVADYFDMLRLEALGQPYSKADHRRALLAKIQRSAGSIEFKHQNISAVLNELGFPWIAGYKPGKNYQAALFRTVAKYAAKNLDVEKLVTVVPDNTAIDPDKAFVDPPKGTNSNDALTTGSGATIRKFDIAKRDARNRALGEEGERFVFELEKARLKKARRPDLADRVKWVSKDDGDGAGYDILSYNSMEQEIFIEVKTTRGRKNSPFYISPNEIKVAKQKNSRFFIYRVFNFGVEAYVYKIEGPLEGKLLLEPIGYRASVAGQ